jgi:membrane-associated protease RseP (regulator of RpoE activity)
MLHEPAVSRKDRPVVRRMAAPISKHEMLQNELRQMVASVLTIEKEHFLEPLATDEAEPNAPGLALQSHLVASFEGKLLLSAEEAYPKLDEHLAKIEHLAAFRETDAANRTLNTPHTIHILTGRIHAEPRPWWPNLVLFIITLLSVMLVGRDLAAFEDPALLRLIQENYLAEFWRGLPFAGALLLILGAHEFGHYFAARYHKLAVTLPYFLPLPSFLGSIVGTMGAFIQLREPMRNRKMLFDVGAAGPLVGLVFAMPILFIGLTQAQVQPTQPGIYQYEGDSLFYALAKTVVFGRFVPSNGEDVLITSSQLAWAGWVGLLVTSLNLIPIGQLDGGHVLYALIGERARRLYWPTLIVLGLLVGVFGATIWMIWILMLLFFGRAYATPLDTITPLDNRRRLLAILTLFIFVVIFVPAPLTIQEYTGPAPSIPPRESALLLGGLLALVWQRWHR